MQRASAVLALLVMFLVATGCSHKISGGPEAGVDMSRYRSFHVVQFEKGKVPTAIQEDLRARGLSVTVGPESDTPAASQVKVHFTDKWMWDITMYLLEVKIEMVDAKTGALLASGRCYRTSTVRKSPQVMVKEITDRIFGNAPAAVAAAK